MSHTHKVTLPVSGIEVGFSTPPSGKDLFALDGDPQAMDPDQYRLLVARLSITRFGDAIVPVPLQTLIALDEDDIDALNEEHLLFLIEAHVGEDDDREQPQVISDTETRLRGGFMRDGVRFTRVHFGRRTTGYDRIECNTLGLAGLRREMALVGKRVLKITDAAGAHVRSEVLTTEDMEMLSYLDFQMLRDGGARFKRSFRLEGDGVRKPMGDAGVAVE